MIATQNKMFKQDVPRLSFQMTHVIEKCMAFNPKERYKDVRTLKRAILKKYYFRPCIIWCFNVLLLFCLMGFIVVSAQGRLAQADSSEEMPTANLILESMTEPSIMASVVIETQETTEVETIETTETVQATEKRQPTEVVLPVDQRIENYVISNGVYISAGSEKMTLHINPLLLEGKVKNVAYVDVFEVPVMVNGSNLKKRINEIEMHESMLIPFDANGIDVAFKKGQSIENSNWIIFLADADDKVLTYYAASQAFGFYEIEPIITEVPVTSKYIFDLDEADYKEIDTNDLFIENDVAKISYRLEGNKIIFKYMFNRALSDFNSNLFLMRDTPGLSNPFVISDQITGFLVKFDLDEYNAFNEGIIIYLDGDFAGVRKRFTP